ncbi:RHS repeat-associated core domain-containing protein [Paenibacillus sp. SI8]|uniref:RHS repeat-associated core domain-containing protein n=1 Tax=unclassified Paenibacillus TaxID=185978 RepID=UPI0034651C0A
MDATGTTKLNSYQYDIFGNIVSQQENLPQPFKYSGEMMDDKVGLQYLRARWYDPSMGRFVGEDTYAGQISNPLSQNRFSYVKNNPLIYTDPSGHDILSLISALEGILAGSAALSATPVKSSGYTPAQAGYDAMRASVIVGFSMVWGKVKAAFNSDSSEGKKEDSHEEERTPEDEGKLTDSQAASLKRAAANLPHLDDRHLEAYERDLNGDPILDEDGEPWDHKTEVENAAAGLRKAVRGLEGSLNNPKLNPEIRKKFEEAVSQGKEILDRVDKIKEKYPQK